MCSYLVDYDSDDDDGDDDDDDDDDDEKCASKYHNMHSVAVTKIPLSLFDDKKHVRWWNGKLCLQIIILCISKKLLSFKESQF